MDEQEDAYECPNCAAEREESDTHMCPQCDQYICDACENQHLVDGHGEQ